MFVRVISLGAIALLLSAVDAPAQAPPTPPTPPGAPPKKLSKGTLKLTFDREVYTYPAGGRPDPFKPQVGTEASGPLFEDLSLRTIIFSPDPAGRWISLSDGSKGLYRLRIGDVLGNARVSAIERDHARFLVQSYGFIKEDTLNLAARRTPEQVRAGQAEAQEQSAQRLFLQELQRALTDTTRGRVPPRRDTIRPGARGRGGN